MKWLLNAQSYPYSSVCRHCAMAGFWDPTEGAIATPSSETEPSIRQRRNASRHLGKTRRCRGLIPFSCSPRDRSPSIFSFEFIRVLLLSSVVEQEKGEKADQNPEHRAENSEPEWDIPVRVGEDIRFCLVILLVFLVSYSPLGNPKACSMSVLRRPVARKPWSL